MPPTLGTALVALPLVPGDVLVGELTVTTAGAAGVALVCSVAALLALRAGDRLGGVAVGLGGLALVAGLAGGARSAVLLAAAAVLVLVLRTPIAAALAVPGLSTGSGVALLGGAPAVVLAAAIAVAAGVTALAVRGEAERVTALLARRAGAPGRRVPLAPPGRGPVRPERDAGWLAAVAAGAWLLLAPGTWELGAGPPPGTAGDGAYALTPGHRPLPAPRTWELGAGPPPGTAGDGAYALTLAVTAAAALGAVAVVARGTPERLGGARLAAWLPPPLDRAPVGRDRRATAVGAVLTAGIALLALVAL